MLRDAPHLIHFIKCMRRVHGRLARREVYGWAGRRPEEDRIRRESATRRVDRRFDDWSEEDLKAFDGCLRRFNLEP